jgi:valyl-tRNA synthetase
MCDLVNHPLVELYRSSNSYDVDAVVRWCPDCGAVVVDEEYDGRVLAGSIMKMAFPKMVVALKK